MGRIVVLAFLAVGCSAPALPGQADPMAIVWEQSYGMERETRPVVAWHGECRTGDWGAGRPRAVGGISGCTTMEMFFDTGVAELQTADAVSDSSFVLALSYWKGHLLGADPGGIEMAAAKRALIDAGL